MEKKKEMLVNRATGLVRVPLARPARKGKTAKDRAKRAGSVVKVGNK